MGAVIRVTITVDSDDDLADAIGELMISMGARYWDDSDATLEQVLTWLRATPARQTLPAASSTGAGGCPSHGGDWHRAAFGVTGRRRLLAPAGT